MFLIFSQTFQLLCKWLNTSFFHKYTQEHSVFYPFHQATITFNEMLRSVFSELRSVGFLTIPEDLLVVNQEM